MKVWEAKHEVATRIADGSCSLEAIVWTVEVALVSTSGTLPKHFAAAAAELEKPSGKAGTTAFWDDQSCDHTELEQEKKKAVHPNGQIKGTC